MKRWLKEPLLHFLIAGTMLFSAYGWLNGGKGDDANGKRVVRVTTAEIEWLKETWTRQWHRPPREEELKVLVASYVKEELLALEAQALGLDENDTIVRRRLAQKMEFLIEDTSRLADPSEEELRRVYQANPARFQTEALISFEIDDSGSRLLEREIRRESRRTVASLFGEKFADEVFRLTSGEWAGPIESAYGSHRVRVVELIPAQPRPFADVRAEILDELRGEMHKAANDRYYASLLKKYEVKVDESIKPLLPQAAMEKGTNR